jgi:hypothetical protein
MVQQIYYHRIIPMSTLTRTKAFKRLSDDRMEIKGIQEPTLEGMNFNFHTKHFY